METNSPDVAFVVKSHGWKQPLCWCTIQLLVYREHRMDASCLSHFLQNAWASSSNVYHCSTSQGQNGYLRLSMILLRMTHCWVTVTNSVLPLFWSNYRNLVLISDKGSVWEWFAVWSPTNLTTSGNQFLIERMSKGAKEIKIHHNILHCCQKQNPLIGNFSLMKKQPFHWMKFIDKKLVFDWVVFMKIDRDQWKDREPVNRSQCLTLNKEGLLQASILCSSKGVRLS